MCLSVCEDTFGTTRDHYQILGVGRAGVAEANRLGSTNQG